MNLCLLKATIGGFGSVMFACKTLNRRETGSHNTTKTGLVLVIFLETSLKATSLGTKFVLLIADFRIVSL